MADTENAPCDNCGSPATWSPVRGAPGLERCDACGGWSFTPAPGLDPELLYGEAYFNGAEYGAYDAAHASHVRNFTRKLRVLSRGGLRRLADMRLLELGCATGEFLRVARDAGVPRHLGVEPSAYCREIATKRGLQVVSPSDAGTNAAIASLRPNVVVAWDVWEHLPHPARELDAVLAYATPDVTVALSTVDASSVVARLRGTRWRQFHPPTHLNYPTRRSLEHYLSSRGFTIRHHASFGYYRPLLEYARALGVTPRERTGGWKLPWTFPLYLNLWDIQLVIATRRQA